jgi:hypothetical protein
LSDIENVTPHLKRSSKAEIFRTRSKRGSRNVFTVEILRDATLDQLVLAYKHHAQDNGRPSALGAIRIQVAVAAARRR